MAHGIEVLAVFMKVVEGSGYKSTQNLHALGLQDIVSVLERYMWH
jgi:hypothetical protein